MCTQVANNTRLLVDFFSRAYFIQRNLFCAGTAWETRKICRVVLKIRRLAFPAFYDQFRRPTVDKQSSCRTPMQIYGIFQSGFMLNRLQYIAGRVLVGNIPFAFYENVSKHTRYTYSLRSPFRRLYEFSWSCVYVRARIRIQKVWDNCF